MTNIDSRLCQKPIAQGAVHVTYCMRPLNHQKYDPKGKCEPRKTDADRKEAETYSPGESTSSK